MQNQSWVLPGGYVDSNGIVHKQFEITALSGREEELLAQTSQLNAQRVTDILSRCVHRIGSIQPVTQELAQGLLVGDRQYLLLMLRQLTFGDRIQSTLLCPWHDCAQRIDIDFNISDIPVTASDEHKKIYEVKVELSELKNVYPNASDGNSFVDIKFRLPNGADQEIVSPYVIHNEAEALTVLLARCVQSIGNIDRPDIELISALPAGVRQQVEQAMEVSAPNLELTMETDCPECGRAVLAPFELQDFFFGELKISTELLFREVHYLAFHYHWSEEEIMQMPRQRRRQYIDVLNNEIEQLNDAAC